MNRFGARLLSCIFVFLFIQPVRAESLVVTDMAGRSVSISTPPTRIACLGPGALRLITYLQATDKLVGIEEIEKTRPGGRPYILAHPEIAHLPRIGHGGPSVANRKPDMEMLLKIKTQLIFATYLKRSQAQALQRTLGIAVVVLRYGRSAIFDDAVFDSIMLAGKLLNREARARQVVDYIHALQIDLKKRTGRLSADRRASAYVGGVSYRGAYGIESTERSYIPLMWANVDNIAESVETRLGSHVFIDREKFLALDPNTIFIDGGGLELIIEDYRKRPDFYRSLTAFRNRRIFTLLPFNSYATNIETALVNAYAIGKVLYPDRFSDIDLEKKSDAIYRFFVGRPVTRLMAKSYAPIASVAPFWKAPSSVSNE